MSAKTSPARRAAFLKALGETGNYGIAAAHAEVSRSWVTLHKTNDPEFRAACEAAVAGAAEQAKARATAGGDAKPSARWGYIDGEEMVVRGERAAGGRRAGAAAAVDAAGRGALSGGACRHRQCEAGVRGGGPERRVGLCAAHQMAGLWRAVEGGARERLCPAGIRAA